MLFRSPITSTKVAGGPARQGMRKVTPTQRGIKGSFPEGPVDLSNMLLPSFADSPLSQFGSLSMNSEIPPGAGAAGLITADFGDDFSSMFPTSITIDPVVALPPFGDVPQMGTMSSTVPQQLSSPLHVPMDPQVCS